MRTIKRRQKKANKHGTWALIEAPIPNAPEGKYISQIPSPNNLLTTASAIMQAGVPKENIKFYNYLRDRKPELVYADNIVYNMGEATCMDYLYNYAIDYFKILVSANRTSNIYPIGFYSWIHKNRRTMNLKNFIKTSAHYFEDEIYQSITGEKPEKGTEFHDAWELNDWEFMKNFVCSKAKGIRCTIRASRGCPHDCRMCPIRRIHERKVRRYSIGWVLQELDTLYNDYNIRQIGFLDDNLFFNRKWGKMLLKKMVARNYKGANFTFEEGLDVPTALDEELVSLMKQAHFTHIKLGVESLNKETLDFIRKPYRDPKQAIAAIKMLQKYKLNPVCFLCVGFPTDTEESLKETFKVMVDLGVKLRVQVLWSYPGIDFAGRGLSNEKLKEMACDVMYDTGSVAWRRPEKSKKSDERVKK